MIDMVEARVIAGQIAGHLLGKRIAAAELAERKKKSMRDAYLLRVKPAEFRSRIEGNRICGAYSKYRHICIETDGGSGVDLSDIYGKVLFIEPGVKIPGNPPILLRFDDGSSLAVLPGVWGAMRLASNEELRTFRDSSNPDMIDASADSFSVKDLERLIAMEDSAGKNIKQVITKHGAPGIMSVMGAYGQEALFRARIHPKRKAAALEPEELDALHRSIRDIVREAIEAGGRESEVDLFGNPGGFRPTLSRESEGKPCPECGTVVEAIKMGGAGMYYICPGCQVR